MADPQSVISQIQSTVMKLATKSNDYPELLIKASETEREMCGLKVLVVPTLGNWTLSEPATWKQARAFEDL